MAVTIEQQPGEPNYSNTELVFVVSSNNVGPTVPLTSLKERHSFVLTVQKAGVSIAVPFRKQANPVGVAVFDLSGIIDANMGYPIDALGATGTTRGSSAFTLTVGEEYLVAGVLTGFTGSAVAGVDVEGEPAVVSMRLDIIKGTGEYNVGLLDAAPAIPELLSTPELTLDIHRDDIVSVSQHVPNLALLISHFNVPMVGDTVVFTVAGRTYTFNIYDERSEFGERRFVWFNRRGGIDYFTTTEEQTTSTSVDKASTQGTTIRFGRSDASNREEGNANVFTSRQNIHKVDYETTNTANTKWLTQVQADALAGLFESPKVYLQEGANYIPVTILNNSYDNRTYNRAQDLFNYTIMWRYSNDKRGL